MNLPHTAVIPICPVCGSPCHFQTTRDATDPFRRYPVTCTACDWTGESPLSLPLPIDSKG